MSEQQRTAGDASGEEQQAGPKRTPAHKPDLKIVTVDPLQEVLDAITTAQESVQSANSAVRGLKSKVRALDRHFKAREKEFEATGRLLTKLKEAASF